MAVRDEGSLLVANWMLVDEFAERINITLDDDRDYEAIAGLVIKKIGTPPALGDHVDIGAWRIEVINHNGRRIDKLLVLRRPTMR